MRARINPNHKPKPNPKPQEVEGGTEARLLALLGGERLDGLEVEVVVEVQVVQVLPMYQQIQHVVALAADLRRSRVAKPPRLSREPRSEHRAALMAWRTPQLSRTPSTRPQEVQVDS